MEKNFTPLQSDALFTPTSVEDYIRPYAAAEQLYQKRKGELEQRADILANYLPYINDSTPEAKKLYDDAQNQFERNLQLLGSKGWNLNPEPILSFKQQYRKTNTLLNKAVTELEKQRQMDDQQRAQKGENICISYELQDGEGNGTGRFTVPNLDNMLRQDVKRYTVDCDDVQQKAMQTTGGAMGRANAAWSRMGETFYARDPETGMPLKGPDGKYIKANMPFTTYGSSHSTSNEGSIGGIRSSMMLEYIMQPERYRKEIAAYKKELVRYCGDEQAAQQVVDAFFNGELRDQLNGVLDQVGYDHQDVPSQNKINLALMRGLYAASGWKENKHVSSHWGETGGGGGRGGSGKESEPSGFDMTPGLFQPESKSRTEKRMKALDWLNIDSSGLKSEGYANFTDKLALVNRGRIYGGAYKNGESKHKKEDEIMRNEHMANNGVKDVVSLFDDDGRLKSKDEFRELFKEICSDEYYNKITSDPNVGKVYNTDVSPESVERSRMVNNDSGYIPTGGGGAAKKRYNRDMLPYEEFVEKKLNNFYKNEQTALLDLYDVPEGQKREILNDATGNKWNEFIASNNINKENMIDRANHVIDEEANTTTDMLTLNYSKDNDYIAKRILAGVQRNDDGDYLLHEVTGDGDKPSYSFSIQKDADGKPYKAFKINRSIDPVEVSTEELFGANGDKGDFEYMLSPNVSDGVLVKNKLTGKQYLIAPGEVSGTTFRAEELNSYNALVVGNNKMIYELRQNIIDCYNRIRRLKYNKGSSEEIEKEKTKILEYQNSINALVAQKSAAYSRMSQTFNSGLSHSAKPNTND